MQLVFNHYCVQLYTNLESQNIYLFIYLLALLSNPAPLPSTTSVQSFGISDQQRHRSKVQHFPTTTCNSVFNQQVSKV